MTVASTHDSSRLSLQQPASGVRALTAALVPVGRLLFSAIFVMSGYTHFNPGMAAYAASAGVPMANVLVPAAGVLAALGGLSVLLGWRARVGAAMLVVFLVPVTLTIHAFWAAKDAMTFQMQLTNFMKNTGLLGGALLIAHLGPGPFSLDARPADARGSERR